MDQAVIMYWPFGLMAFSLFAFGFCLGVLYEHWHFRKDVRDPTYRIQANDVHDLTRRIQAATGRLQKTTEGAEAAHPGESRQ
jgi:hypothetical protein